MPVTIIGGSSGGGGGGGEYPPLLFRWNNTDLSQFDPVPHKHDRDIGPLNSGNADTALALSVENNPRYGNVLRLTATNLAGGGVFPVKTSELTLPERYLVRTRLVNHSGSTQIVFGLYLAYNPAASDFNGIYMRRSMGVSNLQFAVVRANLTRSGVAGTSAGVLNSFIFSRGGLIWECEVNRPTAAKDPVQCNWSCWERRGEGGHSYDSMNNSDVSGDLSTAFDGLECDRIGLGCHEGVNGSTGYIEYSEFSIHTHPSDVT